MNLDFLPKDEEPISPDEHVTKDQLTEKQKRVSAAVIWSLGVISLLLLVGILAHSIYTKRKNALANTPNNTQFLENDLKIETLDTEISKAYDAKILASVNIIKQFTAKSPPESKVSLIHQPNKNKESLISYFKEVKPTFKIKHSKPYLKSNTSFKESHQQNFYIAVVKDQLSTKVIQIPLDKEPLAIDWEAYIGKNESSWEVHRNQALENPKGTKFRCIIRRYPSPYYNNFYSDEKKWVCVSILHPNEDHSIWGYIPRDSKTHIHLTNLLSRTAKKAVILEIKTNSQKELKDNQFEVTNVVSDTWSDIYVSEQELQE